MSHAKVGLAGSGLPAANLVRPLLMPKLDSDGTNNNV